jgi:hypothetical protein
MTKTILSICVFWFVSGGVALFGAAGALPLPASQLPTSPPSVTANHAAAASVTKLIRIFNGAGSFDDALARSLRPILVKAFPFSNSAPGQLVPAVSIAAPLALESQKMIVTAHP